jgi:outer membrane murein-binding lipoprotein Lpp
LFGEKADAAVPALTEAMRGEAKAVREEAAEAPTRLNPIDP